MIQSNGDQSPHPEPLANQLSIGLSGNADQVLIGLNWTAVVGSLGRPWCTAPHAALVDATASPLPVIIPDRNSRNTPHGLG